MVGLEDGRREPESKKVGGLWKLKKARKESSPRTSGRNTALSAS